jgi:tRNA(fMet)-specific endonuclease VapC
VILDTNGLSAVADGEAKLERLLRHAAEIAVPVIVLGEYQYGIRHSRDRGRYEEWLAESIPNYRVLDVDEETAVAYSTLRSELKRAGTRIPSNDAWIAALCRQHSFPLLSRDRHFDSVRGLHRIDW